MNTLNQQLEQHNADVQPLTQQHNQAHKEKQNWTRGKTRAEQQQRRIREQIKVLMEVREGLGLVGEACVLHTVPYAWTSICLTSIMLVDLVNT